MNQLIKISNQLAKILGNYAKCRIRRFNSNNKLLHTSMQYQITQTCIKAQQRMNYLVFLSF